MRRCAVLRVLLMSTAAEYDRARRTADIGAVVLLLVIALWVVICAWTYPNRLSAPQERPTSIGTALWCDRSGCYER